MASQTKSVCAIEFGDFQTPFELALAATKLISVLNIRPTFIVEPSCGKGAFLSAAQQVFPGIPIIGVEINPSYVEIARDRVQVATHPERVTVVQGDFYGFDWDGLFHNKKGTRLIIGNPPWVTSSSLSILSSGNVPAKSNFHGRKGIEAVTGKSNFDISEWMLMRYIDWLKGEGTVAVLCKTSVARKVLIQAWSQKTIRWSHIYRIDAQAYFGAAVDACLFVMELAPNSGITSCSVYDSLEDQQASGELELVRGFLLSGKNAKKRTEPLWGPENHYAWRSGVKHDCSKVMELLFSEGLYRNGLGETVQLESRYLYPMLKGSDVGNGRMKARSAMLVTQEFVGQDTSTIESTAPKTWDYLNRHRGLLDKRASTIYRNRPSFSIFGVGDYTFAPWKVAVSGFHKKLHFIAVGPEQDRPVVFDDTVYFLPCWSEEEARFLEDLLRSSLASNFFLSMIHWSDKRPLTIDILRRLSIEKLAVALGRFEEYLSHTRPSQTPQGQLQLAM